MAGQIRVGRDLAEAARAVIVGGAAPVAPRDAATVMLLRPARAAADRPGHGRAFEVYMLRRKPSMAFAPGAYVFPGGSVDPRDAEEEVDPGTERRRVVSGTLAPDHAREDGHSVHAHRGGVFDGRRARRERAGGGRGRRLRRCCAGWE